jgi:micrococcal nuclease
MLSAMKRTIALSLLLLAAPALAGTIEGKVIEVPDGASITVLAKEGSSIHRIKLAGIDAPGKERAIGGSSRENLRRMARGKTVKVETTTINPRGLLVGVVLIERGPKDCPHPPCTPLFDPGIAQLSSGLAKVDRTNLAHHSKETQKLYLTAQDQARTHRLGLWREGAVSLSHEGLRTR